MFNAWVPGKLHSNLNGQRAMAIFTKINSSESLIISFNQPESWPGKDCNCQDNQKIFCISKGITNKKEY